MVGFYDDFKKYDYGTDLDGQGGWIKTGVGDYTVTGSPPNKYIRNQLFPSGGGGSYYKLVDVASHNLLNVYGYLKPVVTEGEGFTHSQIRLGLSGVGYSCGFKMYGTPHNDILAWSNNSWISVCSFPSHNIYYPFHFIYNYDTCRYTLFEFNGVNYDIFWGNSNIGYPDRIFISYYNDSSAGRYINWDYICVGDFPKSDKKYLKFPRWKKTRYGMRPHY